MPKIDDNTPVQKPEDKSDGPTVRLACGCNEMTAPGGGFVGRALTPKEGESPTVRLAIATNQGGDSDLNVKGFGVKPGEAPTVRLATTTAMNNAWGGADERYPFIKKEEAPTVRLAHIHGAQGDNNLIGQRGVEQLPESSAPALLVSFFYLEPFLANKHRYRYRDWVMDSGAFSAHSTGGEIDLDAYMECCKKLTAEDPTLTEIFSLDVIGDWKASLKNTEIMWEQGIEAIPCFHYGEPWDVLKGLAKDYPKVAIGGCVGRRDKDQFAAQCFARVWPKKLHGFGFGAEKSIMTLPFHSCDATNWEMGPCGFGRWAAFGGATIPVRGSKQNLRVEVDYYLDLEKRARVKWKKEMALLESMDKPPRPKIPLSVRFVVGTGRVKTEGPEQYFGDPNQKGTET